MASIINASTSGAGGVITTADASGVLQLQTGGTTAVTVDASQNVSIAGTTTISKGTTGTLAVQSSGTSGTYPSTGAGFEFVAGSASGQDSLLTYNRTSSAWRDLYIQSNNMLFGTNGSERMRIDSSGNVLVNQTATSAGADGRLSVTTTGGSPAATFKNDAGSGQYTGIFYNSATTGNNSFVLFGTESSFTSRGGITYNRGAGLTAYNTTSDQRLKENIVDATSALSKIDSVKVRSFDWKETGNHVDFGVIAQELIDVAPECVTEGDSNDEIETTWQVDTSALVPALVKAIQELKAIVDTQAERIAALENK